MGKSKTIQVYGFPSHLTAEEVKGFLERFTGKDSVYAIKIRDTKNVVTRKYAMVQFKTTRAAEHIISLTTTSSRLWFGKSYLNARTMDLDIVPKPRTFLCTMEHLTLHFGCQISKERFSVLWKGTDVLVNFGIKMRKIHFFLSHNQMQYQLVLSYENIWQIHLHKPRGQFVKYLLIQLYGAPRIFEKGNVLENPLFIYVEDSLDYQWVRTTDFTPSCLIGHSSALCLEIPWYIQVPKFEEIFGFYEVIEGKFVLGHGSAFSRNLDLVPIVGPPSGVDLPYEILFQVNLLVQNGCLTGLALDASFYKLVDPSRMGIAFIEHALEKLFYLKECCYDPCSWVTEQYQKYLTYKNPPRSPYISLDAGLVYVRRVQITPCKVYFCGPEVNVSNRVLRNYPEDINNFLRVSFVDEELDKMYSTDLSPRASSGNEDRRTAIYKRILSTLRNGIVIGNKRFEFLAFSSSQLRENSCWMFASRNGLTPADIREWMGNFHQIRNVAKYAARLGQSFG